MSFNLLHIWAQMGTLSRIVAVCLLLMATASIAVVVERMFTREYLRRLQQ